MHYETLCLLQACLMCIKAHAEGNRLCVTPSRWGAKLALQLTPQESAEIYTGWCDCATVPSARPAGRLGRAPISAAGP